MIRVVCGIIKDKEKFFVCRRKKGKLLEGFWEFPGGKIEKNEQEEEALKRELWEELGMTVEIHKPIGNSVHDYGSFKINLIGYDCSLISYKGKLTDHDAYEWVDLEELLNIKLAPADIPFINLI